jgi:putative ABC transport system permease protein
MTGEWFVNPNNLRQMTRVALRSLLHHKLRSLLSVLGFVCGVMAVVAMISIGQGAKQETIRQIEQLGTHNIYIKAVALTDNQTAKARERLSRGLTLSDLQRIRAGCAAAAKIACLREINAPILGLPREMTPQVVACSENYAQLLGMHIVAGRFIAPLDRRRRNLVCVLGSETARQMEELGSPGGFIRIHHHLVKVVGILNRIEGQTDSSSTVSARNYNEMVFVPLEVAGTLDSPGPGQEEKTGITGRLSEIVVQVAQEADVVSTAGIVRRIMEVAHHNARDYQLIVPLELLRQAEQTQRTFNLVLGAIAAISLLAGGIGIMNIMLATVSERTREIGIRRAVGATRRHIWTQFLLESVMLTVSGGIIGLLCGFVAVAGISRMAGWPVAISLWAVVLPVIMSLMAGIFFGLYPARQAARVDPIVALRHE